MADNNAEHSGELILYQTEDGQLRLDVRLQNESVWLTQALMAELFQTSQQNISQHINNIYNEGELEREGTHKKFLSVAQEGNRTVNRARDHYNLDMILSVGYRVKSTIATRFRIWATQRLHEYIVKGFTMDDDRLKEPGQDRYFEELLARIRDIRSSEKVFWRKVLDIYATSIDYDNNSHTTLEFFKQVQNQMHWAAHGHTAAELIMQRADANRPLMGITNFPGNKLLKRDVETAKNYLSEDELHILNRIVNAYLEFAELQALSRKAMKMQDWVERLNDFLSMTGRPVLDHAGKVSNAEALEKAHAEYQQYCQRLLEEPTEIEQHFLEAEKKLSKNHKNNNQDNDQ